MDILSERKEENKANDILYNLCVFVTIVTIIMTLVKFFTRGEFPSPRISTFYIGVLVIYSLHKEALRWIGENGNGTQRRKGEYFVYFWIILTTILYFVNFFTKDYFSYSPQGTELSTLEEVSFLTLEIGAVFISTQLLDISKMYFSRKRKNYSHRG